MFWVFVKNDWFSGFFSEEETRIKNEKSDFFERKPKKRGEGMIPIIFCDQEQYYKVINDQLRQISHGYKYHDS